jgi:hypothetical protein
MHIPSVKAYVGYTLALPIFVQNKQLCSSLFQQTSQLLKVVIYWQNCECWNNQRFNFEVTDGR